MVELKYATQNCVRLSQTFTLERDVVNLSETDLRLIDVWASFYVWRGIPGEQVHMVGEEISCSRGWKPVCSTGGFPCARRVGVHSGHMGTTPCEQTAIQTDR